MDQQSNGEEERKISRSKARHLRRKRLTAARRTANSNLTITKSDTEQNSNIQELGDVLTKSKARRLRKKKKAELIKGSGETFRTEKRASDSENLTELLIGNQSPSNGSGNDKFDRNLDGSQFNAVESCDCLDSPYSLTWEEAPNSYPAGVSNSNSRGNNCTLNTVLSIDNTKSHKGQSERDFLSSDDSHVYEASLSQSDHQIRTNLNSKVLTPGTSIDADPRSERRSNDDRKSSNSLPKTVFYQSSLEGEINSEVFDGDESLSGSQILFYDHVQDFKLAGRSRIANLYSNQLSKNDEKIVKETDNTEDQHRKEKRNKSFDSESSNPVKATNLSLLKTDVTSDDDLDSRSSNSSSHLIDQYDINTIQAHDSLGLVAKTTRTVLNATELIENEKNLKISGSSNSNVVFQPIAKLIDLTTYSSSDLIINTDSTSRRIEEQQIIIDLISDSSSELVQNIKVISTDQPEISKTESRNENKSHSDSASKKLLKFKDQPAVDYTLPSTSFTTSGSSGIQHPEDSIGHKTIEHSNCDCVVNEPQIKMSSVEKTREQIKAEREAKKAAKALAKSKAKVPKSEEKTKSAGSTEQVGKDAKKNTTVKKETVPSEEKVVTTETTTAPSAENKENESHSKVDGKSKRESRAERRAKQEAQRAAKEKQAADKGKPKSAGPPKSKAMTQVIDPVKMIVRKALVDNNLHEVKLFKHLYHERELSLVNVPTLNSNIHPAIVRLGVQYANKVIIGSNARCVALLAAVKQLVEDFERPSQADFTRGLEASLQECAAYLHHCRPMAVSMQNALRHLKWQMSQLPTTVSDEDAKSKLGDAIDTYIKEQIELAGKAISDTIQTKISNGDVILTYAFSSLIHKILIDAHNDGKKFRVIVVDGRPWLEGKEQLRRLVKHGIECSYVLINALSFIMPEVSKVFLGAHAILANGAVMSRAGTAQVALMAKAFNVPVLVACETHKSCERVQTDSFVYNEIGDADELVRRMFNNSKKSPLANWKTKKSLDLLNITFDVTPADLVSAVVTELAILPCTSIPVILRIKPSEI